MTTYHELADALHGIADNLATLGDRDAGKRPYFNITYQPCDSDATDEKKITEIDAVGMALLGKAGQLVAMSGGSHHHHVEGHHGAIGISTYNRVTSPEARALREELERLRAEVRATTTAVTS